MRLLQKVTTVAISTAGWLVDLGWGALRKVIRSCRHRPRRTLISLGLLAILLVGAGVPMWLSTQRHAAIEAARPQLRNVAEKNIAALLSYDYRKIDGKLDRASKRITGKFEQKYTRLMRDVVIPRARQAQTLIRTTVVASALISMDTPEKAKVLVLVDQTSRAGNTPEPTSMGGRLKVTLVQVEERWLVSKLERV